jgi:hypothetical protein
MPKTKVDDLVLQISADTRAITRELKKLQKENKVVFDKIETNTDRAAKSFDSFGARISKVTGFAKSFGKAFAVSAAAAGVAALSTAAQRAVSDIAQLNAEAERAGVSFEAFQELKFAADQSRVGLDALTDGLKELQLRADEFAVTGKGSGAEAFQRLGFTAEELSRKLKEPDKLFEDIIGRIQQLDKAAQIRIADEIFGGTGGEQFVQFLDRGVDGIRAARQEARDLGLVLDQDIAAKAEEIDQKFQKITQTIGTNLQRAVVNVAAGFGSIGDAADAVAARVTGVFDSINRAIYGNRQVAEETLRFYNNSNNFPDQSKFGDLLGGGQTRQGLTPSNDNSSLTFTPIEPTTSRAGGGGSSKSGGGGPSPAQRIIQDLQFEAEQIKRTALEQDVYNKLKAAGVDRTSELGQRIESLVTTLDTEKEKIDQVKAAQDQLNQTAQQFGDLAGDALASLVTGAEDAEKVIARLAIQLAKAAIQSQFLSKLQGPGGGGAGANFFSSLASAFVGGFAKGGTIPSGKFGLVGEKGPEFIKGPAEITPMGKGSMGGSVTYNIDARGADQAAIARLEAGLAQRDREFGNRVVSVQKQVNSRGVRAA